MVWLQKTFHLPSFSRGFHIITEHIEKNLPEIEKINIGLLHIFIHHSSASITINENADPTVRVDFESHFNIMVPEDAPYKHCDEGTDDMPAHIKASLLGNSLSVPITRGTLNLGTWQGIYLCEHRNRARGRKITVTVNGE